MSKSFQNQVDKVKHPVANLGRRGISLIEMAVFISLMSLMIVGGSKVYDVKQSYDRETLTSNNIKIIKERIDSYQAKNDRLPCVASLSAAPDSIKFGRSIGSDCTTAAAEAGTQRHGGVRVGALPTRDLGLPDSAMFDGWGNRIVYAVTEAYATNNVPLDTPGKISIKETDGNSVTSGDDNVIYTIYSPGKDRRGAYNMAGKEVETCDTGSIAGQNCNYAGTFVSSSKKTYSGANALTAQFAYSAKAKPTDKGADPDPTNNDPVSPDACTPVLNSEFVNCPATAPAGFPSGATYATGLQIRSSSTLCPTGSGSTPWTTTFNNCCYAKANAETQVVSCDDYAPNGNSVLLSGDVTLGRDFECPAADFGSYHVVTNNCVWCTPTYETQVAACPSTNGGGSVLVSGSKTQRRDFTCPANSWTSWTDITNSCTYCTPTSEVQAAACPPIAGQVNTGGMITQKRYYTCPDQSWGNWYDENNSCTYAPACTPTSESRTSSCAAGYSGTLNEQRDYTCNAGVGSWSAWYPIGGPGPWKTFIEEQHTTTTPEATYLFLSGPDVVSGYEYGDCHTLKREWNVGYNSNSTIMIDNAYAIIDPLFNATFGAHYDKSTLFTVTYGDPGMVYQSSHITGVNGGYVPWLEGVVGADSYSYCSKRRQTSATCVQSCSPTSESRTVTDQCPAGQAGSKTQQRDYTCSGGAGTWGPWQDIANNCAPVDNCNKVGSCEAVFRHELVYCPNCSNTTNCSGWAAIYNSTNCPSSIVVNDLTSTADVQSTDSTKWFRQASSTPVAYQTSNCNIPNGLQAVTYKRIYDICSNLPTCTPTSETRTVSDQCPAGQTGTTNQQRDYTCSGSTGTWGGWYDTSNNCTAAGCANPGTCQWTRVYDVTTGNVRNDLSSSDCPGQSIYSNGQVIGPEYTVLSSYPPEDDMGDTSCSPYGLCATNEITIEYCNPGLYRQ